MNVLGIGVERPPCVVTEDDNQRQPNIVRVPMQHGHCVTIELKRRPAEGWEAQAVDELVDDLNTLLLLKALWVFNLWSLGVLSNTSAKSVALNASPRICIPHDGVKCRANFGHAIHRQVDK